VEPLTRGLPLPDLCSLCPLSSTEFVETPPPRPKIFLGTPLKTLDTEVSLSATFITANATWSAQVLNLGLHSENLAIRQRYNPLLSAQSIQN
jgi:hypothetical protein